MSTIELGFVHRDVPGKAGAPTLLLLHGTGGDEDDLLTLGPLLDPDAALLSPRGQVLENGAPRFFRRLAEGVFDEEDVKRRAADLAAFVRAACGTYGLDPGTVVAVGFSNGANIAGAVLLTEPDVLPAAILLRPMVPLVPEPLPDLAGAAVFVGAGRADVVVAPTETERLADLLRRCGAEVTVQWQPGGHALTRGDVDAAREWLEEWRRRPGTG